MVVLLTFNISSSSLQRIIIDVCKLAGSEAIFLQQASHLTGGTYLRIPKRSALLQYLMVSSTRVVSYPFSLSVSETRFDPPFVSTSSIAGSRCPSSPPAPSAASSCSPRKTELTSEPRASATRTSSTLGTCARCACRVSRRPLSRCRQHIAPLHWHPTSRSKWDSLTR